MSKLYQIESNSSYKHINMLSLLLCIGVAAAGRLDNTYLPPFNGRSAGGNGNFLRAPNNGFNAVQQQYRYQTEAIIRPSSLYGAPSSTNGPALVYGAPNGYYNGNGGASTRADARANILRYNNENNGDGNYRFEYQTENKISQQEVGQVKDVSHEGGVTVVQGTYSYVGDDGQTYTVNYVADENGFQPAGEHIHKEIQMTAAEAARTAVAEVGYPSANNGQAGYRY